MNGVLSLLAIAMAYLSTSTSFPVPPSEFRNQSTTVLVLGGGVSGIIAARELHSRGIDDFLLVDAQPELGGRLKSFAFGETGRKYTVELGANWVQGTRQHALSGGRHPISQLVKKHNVKTQECVKDDISTFDENGASDYFDIAVAADAAFAALTASAGGRIENGFPDTSARSGFDSIGWRPLSSHEEAAEYFNFDYEYSQTPEEGSWYAAAWNSNLTYAADAGGFGGGNRLSVDQRGFKTFIVEEAKQFLQARQLLLNTVVDTIRRYEDGVEVTLNGGQILHADHVLVTFSLGVLQGSQELFLPPLPDWKRHAIASMNMTTYTKLFLQFPTKFWFESELALYASSNRGEYPVWQSLDHPRFLPDSGILFATVTGGQARALETLPDEGVVVHLLRILGRMFPDIPGGIPNPVAFARPHWGQDPFFRGSYSNWPVGFTEPLQNYIRDPVDGRLWFAGEHTSRAYFGFLHGAYFEGFFAGHRIADCILAGRCHPQNVKDKALVVQQLP